MSFPVALDGARVIGVEKPRKSRLTKGILGGGFLRPVSGRQSHDLVKRNFDILRIR